MKLNSETADFMDFRHEEFDKQLKEINDIVTGRNTALSAYICDENGKASDEKIDRFISELLDGLINYHKQLYSNLPYTLSEETRELYECFLYCTIQGVAHMKYVEYLHYTVVQQVSTFSDILDILYHSFTYKDRRELLSIEQLGYPVNYGDTGFFRNCNLAYEILTGSDILDALTAEEAEIVDDIRKKQAEQQVYENYDDDEEEEDYFKQVERELLAQKPPMTDEEMLEQLEGSYDEEKPLISDYEAELCAKAQASQNEWKNEVVSPEKFIAKYLRYRELFFAIDHSKMQEDIEKMIDVFLYEQGLSAFSLGKNYVMIPYRTERFCGILKSEIRKARCRQ